VAAEPQAVRSGLFVQWATRFRVPQPASRPRGAKRLWFLALDWLLAQGRSGLTVRPWRPV